MSDQGRGIPLDVLDRVFDRFHSDTSGSRHRGVGLGLSIVRSLVELHGGQVLIDSAPGEGTTVTCIFPVAEAERASDAPPGRRARRDPDRPSGLRPRSCGAGPAAARPRAGAAVRSTARGGAGVLRSHPGRDAPPRPAAARQAEAARDPRRLRQLPSSTPGSTTPTISSTMSSCARPRAGRRRSDACGPGTPRCGDASPGLPRRAQRSGPAHGDGGRRHAAHADIISGEHYEIAVPQLLLQAEGWRCRTTPATGDQGADLIAEADGCRVVIQCKFSPEAGRQQGRAGGLRRARLAWRGPRRRGLDEPLYPIGRGARPGQRRSAAPPRPVGRPARAALTQIGTQRSAHLRHKAGQVESTACKTAVLGPSFLHGLNLRSAARRPGFRGLGSSQRALARDLPAASSMPI